MTVLILSCEEDVTADMVVVHLNASGVPVVRLANVWVERESLAFLRDARDT